MQQRLILFLILVALLVWFVLENNSSTIELSFLFAKIETTPGILAISTFVIGTTLGLITTWTSQSNKENLEKENHEQTIHDLRRKIESIESKIDVQQEFHFSNNDNDLDHIEGEEDNNQDFSEIEFEYEHKTNNNTKINTYFKE